MLYLKNFFRFFSFVFLILTLNFTAFAQESTVDIDVIVFNTDGEAFGEVTVYIYTLDEDTGEYQASTTGYMTNSSTLTNTIPVVLGSTFYAIAYDGDGNIYKYSDDPDNDSNIWIVLSDNLIENVDTGETRIPYVELYISEETVEVYTPEETDAEDDEDTTDDDSTESSDDESSDDDSTESSTDPDTMTTISDPSSYDLFELDITVHTNTHGLVENAEVYVHVDNLEGVELFTYDVDGDGTHESGSISTDANGETSGLNIPIGYEFHVFALAYDSDSGVGTTYGGTYDSYYDRGNYWISYDGVTMENVATGEISPTSLTLHPGTLIPWDVEEGDLDPATYLCGDFEDAAYSDLSFEECEAIEYVIDEGIFEGTGEGLLEPFRAINRAEVTKVMVEYFDIEIMADISEVETFPDVAMDSWYTNYVYTARAHEIVDGYPDGYFKPENPINKVEMLRIFIESSGVTDEESYLEIPDEITYYNDIEVNLDDIQWYIRYANYAFLNNLIENDGNLYPSEDMTRMDVIKLLYRASML